MQKKWKKIQIVNNYKGLCYDKNDPITTQSLVVFDGKNEKKLIFKPTDRYIKVFESLELFEPDTDNIIKRKLISKNLEGKKKNK